jgi:hypothetical protein
MLRVDAVQFVADTKVNLPVYYKLITTIPTGQFVNCSVGVVIILLDIFRMILIFSLLPRCTLCVTRGVTMIDVERLAAYAGADTVIDIGKLELSIETADNLVENFVGTSIVPEEVLDHATLIVAANLFEQGNLPSTTQEQYGTQYVTMRTTRDPMSNVYKILRPWVLPF